MNHTGTVELETERLILRSPRREDADAMYRNWASDPEIPKYMTWPVHKTPEETERVIRKFMEEDAVRSYYHWMIVLKEINEPIGTIGTLPESKAGYASPDQCAVGYCVSRKYWNRSIMTEALGKVIDYLFGTVGYYRIEATHDAENPASGRVMCKCGMLYEGTRRAGGRNNHNLHSDVVIYGILKSDWEKRKNSRP